MWLRGSHSRFQFLLSLFAPLLAAGAEPSQDRPRASFPPAASSSLSPAPSDPPVPQGTVWEVRISAEFFRQLSELVFLQLPAPPAALPLRAPPAPLRPWERRRSSGQPLCSPPAARIPARPPRQRHRPRRPRLQAARGDRTREAAACSPPGRSASRPPRASPWCWTRPPSAAAPACPARSSAQSAGEEGPISSCRGEGMPERHKASGGYSLRLVPGWGRRAGSD